MLTNIFYGLQFFLIVCGLFFVYQCGVFVWYSGSGLLKGENGITFGILVIYAALLFGGLWTSFEAVIFGANFLYGPFVFLTIPPAGPPYHLVVSSSVRLFILILAVIGNHLLYFALRKVKNV